MNEDLMPVVRANVAVALQEDIGSGDLTASLLPPDSVASATVITRQAMVVAGCAWFDETYRAIDPAVQIEWLKQDGESAEPGQVLCRVQGPARSVVSGERCALNFLQLLSATATATAAFVAKVAGTNTRILDTRKTLPGLRRAQKFAVVCGGGLNHRIGLFDAILIKENHILASGGIADAVAAARQTHGALPVEIEVESIDELRQALLARSERVLLDNFSLAQLEEAVLFNKAHGKPPAELEASGGVTLDSVGDIARTGVDYISVGTITKDIAAIDLSMRFD
ncbi:MAG: carboxylating nicotinate-nucleotide diphosphorylase [Woeseiaceae bacterium]